MSEPFLAKTEGLTDFLFKGGRGGEQTRRFVVPRYQDELGHKHDNAKLELRGYPGGSWFNWRVLNAQDDVITPGGGMYATVLSDLLHGQRFDLAEVQSAAGRVPPGPRPAEFWSKASVTARQEEEQQRKGDQREIVRQRRRKSYGRRHGVPKKSITSAA